MAAEEIYYNGFCNVGVIYDESHVYSCGIYEAFAARMDELGIAYKAQTFDKENSVDFSAQALALADCDVVFMPIYYNEAYLFITRSVEFGSNAVFLGSDTFDGIEELISGVENTVNYITHFNAESYEPQIIDFVEAYEAEYGSVPDQFAACAYDAVMILAYALEEAEVQDYTLSAKDLGDILCSTITDKDFYYNGLTGSNMTWNDDGKCSKSLSIVNCQN